MLNIHIMYYIYYILCIIYYVYCIAAPARLKHGTAQGFRLANPARTFFPGQLAFCKKAVVGLFPGQLAFCKKAVVGLAAKRIF